MSLKMKLTSAIIMFMLAIATLVIGVLAAQTQSIHMEGTINFEISDRSLYVKNVRLEDSDGTITEITSFMPGYINDGITLSLGTHTVSNTSFKIHFALINTTALTYDAGEVTLSSELQSANVIATASGTISPTTEDIPEGEDYAPITDSTPISGTITLAINSPNTTSIDLNGITVEVKEYEPEVYADFTFENGALVSYVGTEDNVIIPSSYSVRESAEDYIVYEFANKEEVEKFLSSSYMSGVYAMQLAVGNYTLETPSSSTWIDINTTTQNVTTDNPLLLLDDTLDFPCKVKIGDFTLDNTTENAQKLFATDATSMIVVFPMLNVFYREVDYVTINVGQDSYTITLEDILTIDDENVDPNNQMLLYMQVMENMQSPNDLLPYSVSYGPILEYIEGTDFTVTQIASENAFMDYVWGFYGASITSVELPSSLEVIGRRAFDSCASLTDVSIPASVTSINYQGFYNCTSLQSVTFEDNSNLQTIGEYAFQNSSITSITIPEMVASIDNAAFQSCTNLATVVIKSENIYTNATDVIANVCGEILNNATTVKVPTSIVNAYENSYLESETNFTTDTETIDGVAYTVFTKVGA